MAKNYWMVVMTPENFDITKNRGFDLYGMRPRHRRRAQRMEPEDLVLIYVNKIRKWTAITKITSKYFEGDEAIWKYPVKNTGSKKDAFPYRIKMKPTIVLPEQDYIDARIIGPTLEYVKRWAPEQWPLAFMDALHLIPQADFRLIENEMNKLVTGKPGQRIRLRNGKNRSNQRGNRPTRRDNFKPNREQNSV